MSQPKLSAKEQRWLAFLADFSLDVQYKSGAQNILPDALSRLPLPVGDTSSSDQACVFSMTIEHSWLSEVHEGQQTDKQLAPYLVCASLMIQILYYVQFIRSHYFTDDLKIEFVSQ